MRGDIGPGDALIKQADMDIFHPLSLVASEIISEFGSLRGFIISNRKFKRRYKYRTLLMDVEHLEIIKILKPQRIYSEKPLPIGVANYHIYDTFLKYVLILN